VRLIKVLWPIIIICSALAALLVMLVFPGNVARPPLIMLFLFICPGMSLVRFLHLKELVDKLALGLALSFSIDGIVAGIYLYTDHWSPAEILMTLAVTSIVAVIIEVTKVHIFVYRHVSLVRRLGALLTHPLIIGTRSGPPSYGEGIVEEVTVRVVSVQSISKLLPGPTSEDIEKQATLQMTTVKPSFPALERFDKQATVNVLEGIEEKATLQMASVNLSSTARERFEHQTTAQMPSVRDFSKIEQRVNRGTHIPQQRFPGTDQWQDDIVEDVDIEKKDTHHHGLPIVGKHPAGAEADVDIEKKDTLHVANVSAMPQVANEDVDRTVRVSGPPWMQRQLNITNGDFPDKDKDDIENRPTRHMANVSLSEQAGVDASNPQKSIRDNIHINAQSSANQEEERSDSFTNNRTPSKKRLATKFIRIEK
jgi:hypothetical protein